MSDNVNGECPVCGTANMMTRETVDRGNTYPTDARLYWRDTCHYCGWNSDLDPDVFFDAMMNSDGGARLLLAPMGGRR